IDESMDILATPLALMLKKAIESSPDMQIKVYKRLGDTSLYLAGYFPAYFNRKTYDLAYYIDMGTAAYEQTSALMRAHKNDRHFSKVYSGLAQDFHKLVNIITELSESTPVTQDQDLIMAYKRWQSNKSGTLRRVLAEEGIKPIPSKDKASQ
ncbi:MAG: hypothetical protein NTX25_07320, partial [Proteobacteria bacterium]|nr:hypothetical protein [Pseudomonadota bacterium]